MSNIENEPVPQAEVIELAAEVVAAYVSNNTVSAGELPELINSVQRALLEAQSSGIEAPKDELKPAVPVRRSVTPDAIICLEDGKRFKSLKRHLQTHHNLTPQEYRERWSLPLDYPMTAPNYAAARSELAKNIGLGQKRETTAPKASPKARSRMDAGFARQKDAHRVDETMAELPIHQLIKAHLIRLGLSQQELVSRIGYQNVGKGIRRLQNLMAGDVRGNEFLIAGLPTALEVSELEVKDAIDSTAHAIADVEQREEEKRQARWLARFTPHAILLTERQQPQPVFPVAMFGPERFLRIDFNPDSHRSTYVRQVLARLPDKLSQAGDGTIPCFGRPIGFVINYEHDRAVRFSLDGEALEALSKPYQIGHTKLTVNGRDVPLTYMLG